MFLFSFESFEDGMQAGDEYRNRRNWIGPWSLSLVMAKSCYRIVLEKFPKHPDRYRAAQMYGVCCRMQHHSDEGIHWLVNKALVELQRLRLPKEEHDVIAAGIHRDIGMCLSDLRSAAEAKLEFQLALDFDPFLPPGQPARRDPLPGDHLPGVHPFPSRTRPLSPEQPMVVGR